MFCEKRIICLLLFLGVLGVWAGAQAEECLEYGDYTVDAYHQPFWYAKTMTVAAGHVFVGAQDSLHVLSVVDRTNLVQTQVIGLPETVNDLYSDGNTLYLVLQNSLQIINVETPSSLELIGSCELLGGCSDPYVLGGRLYLAAGSFGVLVVNIDNPEEPFPIYDYSCGGTVTALGGVGSHVAAAVEGRGLVLLDVGDPDIGVEVGVMSGLPEIEQLIPDGDVLYWKYGYGVVFVDVSDPQLPQELSRVTAGQVQFHTIAYGEDRLYMGGRVALFVYDVSDPSSPVLSNSIPEQSYCPQVLVDGCLVASTSDRLSIFDLVSPSLPQRSSMELQAQAQEMVTVGDLVYVASLDVGLEILDYTDMAHPVSLGQLSDMDGQDIAAPGGGYIYLVEWWAHEIKLVDVQDPATPIVVGSFPTTSVVTDIEISGHYLYCLQYYSRDYRELRVLDVSTPEDPVLLGTVLTLEASEMAVSGDRVYLSGGDYGCSDTLSIVDVSDPTNPFMISATPVVSVCKLVVQGDYVYTAGSHRVEVYDVSNPYFPYLANVIQGGISSSILLIKDDILYLASSYYAALSLFDIHDPLSEAFLGDFSIGQELVGSFNSSGVVLGLGPDGETILYARNRVTALDLQCCNATTSVPEHPIVLPAVPTLKTHIVNSFPNPFNPETTVSFQVRGPEHLTLAVYDVQGRLVQQLASNVFQPGDHEVVWRGRDTSGRNVSSGVYLIRLQGEQSHSTLRVSLLK